MRKRADRIIDNLVVGLARLSSTDGRPDWFEGHIVAAQNGTTPPYDGRNGANTKKADASAQHSPGGAASHH